MKGVKVMIGVVRNKTNNSAEYILELLGMWGGKYGEVISKE